jgi:type I restriction enzyme S subunit
MSEGWQIKTLDEVCEFSNGLWKGEKPPFVRIGVIRNTNFTKEGTLNNSDIAYLDVELKKPEKRRLNFGDVILEKSGGGPKQPVGRVALFVEPEGEFSFSNFTSALRVRDPQKLDFRFLHKFLHWTYLSGVTEGMQSHSTGIRNLNGDAYKAIQISFPKLAEQKRIVTILHETFEGIEAAVANAEKNLASARELFESYLTAVFTKKGENWITEPLGANVRFVDYRGKTPPKRDTGIRLITAKNVKMGFVQRSPEEFVDPSAYDAWMTRGFPMKGDVLFTTEAPLGNVAQLDTDEAVIIGQRLITFQPNSKVLDRAFLKFALMSRPIQQEIFRRRTGATVSGIRASLLKQVIIYFPRSTSVQVAMASKIAEVSEACQRLESISLRKLNALSELKLAILQKAFAGGLNVQLSNAVQKAAE